MYTLWFYFVIYLFNDTLSYAHCGPDPWHYEHPLQILQDQKCNSQRSRSEFKAPPTGPVIG